jgi:hypothetical protein
VHKRTDDHLPPRTAYERFNKRLALVITQNVGTMTCFWLFCMISLSSLPALMVGQNLQNEAADAHAWGSLAARQDFCRPRCVSWGRAAVAGMHKACH